MKLKTDNKATPHLIYSEDTPEGTICVCPCGEEVNINKNNMCPHCKQEFVFYSGYDW